MLSVQYGVIYFVHINSLNHYKTNVSFLYHLIVHQKYTGFQAFWGGIKREHRSNIYQGLTIHVCHVQMYAYFYWRTCDFGHAYIDMYAHFFPMIFESSGSYNFLLFKNLMLYIRTSINFFALWRDRFFTVYISFQETLFSNFSCKLFNKFFSLPQHLPI